jgi:hypothetical protein
LSDKAQAMTITNDAMDNDGDIVVVPEAQMEEGTMRHHDNIPAATAVIAEAVEPWAAQDATTHALTGSNRFVPVAIASALPPDHVSSSIEEDDVRPDLLSATVYKHSRDAKIGIALLDKENVGVTVKRIEPEGLFGSSGFQVGDQLMSVSSESCEGLDSRGVAELMRKADGIVTVVVRAPNGRADRVSSMVMKQSSNSRVGIGFRNRSGKLVVSSVAEDGLFAHSLLNAFDTCISINGIACDENINATAAATIIRTSSSFVTIVAKTRHETGVVVAASAMAPPLTPSTTAPAMYAAAVVESSPPLSQSPQGTYTNRQKEVCSCVLCSVIVLIVVITALVVTNNTTEVYTNCSYLNCNTCGYNCYDPVLDDWNFCCDDQQVWSCSGTCPDINDSCHYARCNVCGRNCLNETTGNNDHCCRLESTYTCSEGCGTNILCNICEYTFVTSEDGLEGDYVCAEELTYTEYGECPCTYKLCDRCGLDCFNETTSQFDYCCSKNYTFTCGDICPPESAPSAFAPSFVTPITAPVFAPTTSPQLPAPSTVP